MNKKIKIIELLNKTTKEEKVPKKIAYQDKIFEKSEDNDYTTNDGIPLVHLINYNLSNLNDEVEILEDNTEEIEELPDNIDEFGWLEVKDKINELVKQIR